MNTVASTLKMGFVTRGLLVFVGIVSWVVGGLATFFSDNETGAVALIGVGGIAAALGSLSRWPTRIGISGNELTFDDARDAIGDQIDEAQKTDDGEAAVAQLKDLREHLKALQQTGSIPPPGPRQYDDGLKRAIRRVRDDLQIESHQPGRSAGPDFLVRNALGSAWVETKWLKNEKVSYRGTSLDPLLAALTSDERLLVIVNAHDVGPAKKKVQILRPEHTQLISWVDSDDDGVLKQSLDALLPSG